MRAAYIARLVALSSAAQINAAHAECLRFEPVEVRLTGMLSKRLLPGPPNYESIAEGDRAEPVCVDADPASEINGEAQAGLREVQIRWLHGDLSSLVGKKVIVRAA